jgi:hypothetical protein
MAPQKRALLGKDGPIDQQQDQQLLFLEGMTYDLMTGYGNTTTRMSFNRPKEDSKEKNSLVAALGLGWNQFIPWLREMDDLRRSNLFAMTVEK